MVKTRFAPSPTGSLHVGGLRTAAYAYALAKNSGGNFILRIEDTDKKREVAGAKEKIKEILTDFGLIWDEYYEQSVRAEKGIYKEVAEKLFKEGKAFYCQCSAKNAKQEGYSDVLRDPCRDKNLTSGAIKLRVPDDREIGYHDLVIGKDIKWKTNTVADTTLLKSDNYPTYHLAVVVDDREMDITHVLRGYDWMPSTPIHLLVYEYLGYNVPEIGHLTDIQDPEGGKLSKRKGSVAVEGMLSEGYLKEAIFNFIILLGWAPKNNEEIFDLDKFVKEFRTDGFQKSNPVFDREKLDWFNGYYIRQKTDEELASLLVNFAPKNASYEEILRIVPLVKDRIKKLSEFSDYVEFFFVEPDVEKDLLGENSIAHLHSALEILEKIDTWNIDTLNEKLMAEVKAKNFKTGDFFMDLRIAITGKKFTPPINDSIILLGKEKTLHRLQKLIN